MLGDGGDIAGMVGPVGMEVNTKGHGEVRVVRANSSFLCGVLLRREATRICCKPDFAVHRRAADPPILDGLSAIRRAPG